MIGANRSGQSYLAVLRRKPAKTVSSRARDHERTCDLEIPGSSRLGRVEHLSNRLAFLMDSCIK